VLGQTAAVLVSFPTFFTSQFATTCALALALGLAGALAGTTHARHGGRAACLALRQRCQRGSVAHGLVLVAASSEGRALVRHAGRHRVRVHQRRPAELHRRLRRPARGVGAVVVVRLLGQRRARNALGHRRHSCDVAAGSRAHALAAGDAVGRVDVADGQRVRVRAGLGQRAGHGARVAVLRRRTDVDGLLERRRSQHGRGHGHGHVMGGVVMGDVERWIAGKPAPPWRPPGAAQCSAAACSALQSWLGSMVSAYLEDRHGARVFRLFFLLRAGFCCIGAVHSPSGPR
jgi:hypothetical protein